MRSGTKYTITSREVHDRTASTLQEHIQLTDHGRKCTASLLITILLYAASRITSIFDACQRLAKAPSDQALRDALRASLPPIHELERRLNAGLAADLPRALRKRRYPLALDLTLIPYHGEPFRSPEEIYRGEPKSGTSHFHAYATAYVVRHGERFTVAMTRVLYGDPLKAVVQRLLQQASRIGVKPRYLLLDRGFYNVAVVRYLQAARYPFLMPVARRGRKPRDPEKSQSVWRFFTWKRSGWSEHPWRDNEGRLATVGICVVYGCFAKRGKAGRRQTMVYAYWGFRPQSCAWVRETYRLRFGIETTPGSATSAEGALSAHTEPRNGVTNGAPMRSSSTPPPGAARSSNISGPTSRWNAPRRLDPVDRRRSLTPLPCLTCPPPLLRFATCSRACPILLAKKVVERTGERYEWRMAARPKPRRPHWQENPGGNVRRSRIYQLV